MTTRTIIVYGEQGSGKTQFAEFIRKQLGCSAIIDDWAPGNEVVPGALHFTNSEDVKKAIALLGDSAKPLGFRVWSQAVKP